MRGCVKLRICSPMFFRAPGEFSPTARGPRATAESLPLPTPSTIAGLLATSLGRYEQVEAKEWDKRVEQALGIGEGYLRGPYLLTENDDVYLCFADCVVKIEEIPKLLEAREREIDGAEKIKFIEHIGVQLGGAKTVEKGYMYTAKFVDYLATLGTTNVWVGMDVNDVNLEGIDEKVLRFGGEGRVAKIEVGQNQPLGEFVQKNLSEAPPHGSFDLFLVSHSLFVPDLGLDRIDEGAWIHLGIFKSIRELVREMAQGKIVVKEVEGQVCLLGAGYDLKMKKRKPVYLALSPGSVIRVKGEKEAVRQLYEKGFTVKGNRLGYGTFIPFSREH